MMSSNKDEEDRKRGHALARSQTDPLFLQDAFLFGGHDTDTKNATASFVQFEGKQYAVTCRHVLEVVEHRNKTQSTSRFPTLALVVGRLVLNLSFFQAEGIQYAFRTPEPNKDEEPLDLAIADISGVHWGLLEQRKGKRAIDLDNWLEPRWARAETMVAAGYPDEHKRIVPVDGEERLGAPCGLATARIHRKIDRHQKFAEMWSTLEEPHGYFLAV
jgi:hypothetical protein